MNLEQYLANELKQASHRGRGWTWAGLELQLVRWFLNRIADAGYIVQPPPVVKDAGHVHLRFNQPDED